MTKRKIMSIVAAVLLACVVAGGSFYYYASHHVASMIPGHAYQYTSRLDGKDNSRTMYIAFSGNSDKAIVTQDKSEVLKAIQSDDQLKKSIRHKARTPVGNISLMVIS